MTLSDIQQLIVRLGFTPDISGNMYTKIYPQHKNYRLELDLTNRRIKYPDPIKVSDETTSHFNAPENFVVLECIDRLLTKGYEPQHIELERRWALGRTGKSGKADITVFDRDGQSLIVIECKPLVVSMRKRNEIQQLVAGNYSPTYSKMGIPAFCAFMRLS